MKHIILLSSSLGDNLRASVEADAIYPALGDCMDINATQRVLDLHCLQSVEILTPGKPATRDNSRAPGWALAGGLVGYGLTKSFGWAGAGALVGALAAEHKTKAEPAVLGLRFADGSTAAVAAWPKAAGVLQMSARGANAASRNPVASRSLTPAQIAEVKDRRYNWPVYIGLLSAGTLIVACFLFLPGGPFHISPSDVISTGPETEPLNPHDAMQNVLTRMFPLIVIPTVLFALIGGIVTSYSRRSEDKQKESGNPS